MLKHVLTVFAILGLASSAAYADAPTVQLGGRVRAELGPMKFGIPSEVRIYSDGACVGATTAQDGWYMFALQPGRYWLQVLVDGREVATQSVTLATPSSLNLDILPALPLVDAPPAMVKAPPATGAAQRGG